MKKKAKKTRNVISGAYAVIETCAGDPYIWSACSRRALPETGFCLKHTRVELKTFEDDIKGYEKQLKHLRPLVEDLRAIIAVYVRKTKKK